MPLDLVIKCSEIEHGQLELNERIGRSFIMNYEKMDIYYINDRFLSEINMRRLYEMNR